MLAYEPVGLLQLLIRHVIDTVQPQIDGRIGVARRLIREEPQWLVILDCECDALGDIWLDQLCAPAAVIGAHDLLHNIVQQAGEYDLLIHAA